MLDKSFFLSTYGLLKLPTLGIKTRQHYISAVFSVGQPLQPGLFALTAPTVLAVLIKGHQLVLSKSVKKLVIWKSMPRQRWRINAPRHPSGNVCPPKVCNLGKFHHLTMR